MLGNVYYKQHLKNHRWSQIEHDVSEEVILDIRNGKM